MSVKREEFSRIEITLSEGKVEESPRMEESRRGGRVVVRKRKTPDVGGGKLGTVCEDMSNR